MKKDAIMNKATTNRLLFWAAGLLLLCTAFSRTCGVLYSIVATDVLYAETFLPTLCTVCKQLFDAAIFGVGIAAMLAARTLFSKKAARGVLALLCAALFIDALSAFLVDALTGSVARSMLPLAALVDLGKWLANALSAFLAYAAIALAQKKNFSLSRARITAVLACMLVSAVSLLVNIILFLIEVEFAPYAEEIRQIALEIWQLIYADGAAVWAVSAISAPLFSRIAEES